MIFIYYGLKESLYQGRILFCHLGNCLRPSENYWYFFNVNYRCQWIIGFAKKPLYFIHLIFTCPLFCPTKKTFLPLIRADFGYFMLNLGLILVNFGSFWLILAYFWGYMANFGQNHPNSHAKSNLPGYLYVMNYNFVNTEPIFKIRNSAESYCLAELIDLSKIIINLPPPPPLPATESCFLFSCGVL